MAFSSAKVFLTAGFVLTLLINIKSSSCSSIPIWELLTRYEKLSYIYPTFAQLVSDHCKATAAGNPGRPVTQCKRDLLSYGSEKIQGLSEAQLDTFDPYQRGSNELIWSTVMRDHPSSALLVTTRSPSTLPPMPTKVSSHQQQQPPLSLNPLFAPARSDEQPHKLKYAAEMDAAAAANRDRKTYLSGPSVVRVRPDGTPVEEDRHLPLPRDDDELDWSLLRAGVRLVGPSADAAASSHENARHRRIATISTLREPRLLGLSKTIPLTVGSQPNA